MVPSVNNLSAHVLPGLIPGAPVLIALLLKGLILFTLVAAADALIRRRSAAWRHALWSLSLIGVLALPLLEPLLPGIEFPWVVIPPAASQARIPAPGRPAVEMEAEKARPAALNGVSAAATPVASAREGVRGDPGSPAYALDRMGPWLVRVWCAGVLFFLFRLGIGLAGISWICRRAREVRSASWRILLEDLCRAFGMKRRPRLLVSAQATTPMTWGWARPVIVLPSASESWSRPHRRMVLAHEMAHVKRNDVLLHVLGRVARAIHWVDPLAWIAVHRMRIESEHACDDAALLEGARPVRYAEGLLEFARLAPSSRRVTMSAIEMAPRSELEKRLRAVLNPRQARAAVGKRAMRWAWVVALGVVLPLSSVRLLGVAPSSDLAAPGPSARAGGDRRSGVCEQDGWAPKIEEDPEITRRALSLLQTGGDRDRLKAVRALGNSGTPESVPALIEALDDPDEHVRQDAASALGHLAARRAVGALIAALEDPNDHVREAAIGALGVIGDPAALDPLARQLHSPNEHLRQSAAGALGSLGEARAIVPLIEALRDANKHVRQSAAGALGHLGDPRAEAALAAALDDPEPHVQAAAAQALGETGALGVSDRIARLFDSSGDEHVRLAAARSLGRSGDLRGLSFVISMLGEEEPFTRVEAAWALGAIGPAPGSEAALQSALRDESGFVRYAAVCSLGRLGGRRSEAALRQLQREASGTPEIRAAAEWALRQIESRDDAHR